MLMPSVTNCDMSANNCLHVICHNDFCHNYVGKEYLRLRLNDVVQCNRLRLSVIMIPFIFTIVRVRRFCCITGRSKYA